MPTPQSAILPETGSHGLFLTLDVDLGAEKSVLHQCIRLEQARKNASPDADHTVVVSIAFGSDFWRRISPQQHPLHLKPFEPLGSVHQAIATGGDVLVHCHSNRPDLNFDLTQLFLSQIKAAVTVSEEVQGFRYHDSRDLTGFIDGTENPEGDERAEVALIGDEDNAFAGGSYVLAQRYIHKLDQWRALADDEQEQIIGRTKPDSIELDESVLPDTAHISCVVIEEDGEELEIVRHSMPYGHASGDSGLQFLAYSCDLTIFEKMLNRMYGDTSGHADDAKSDRLLDFSKAVTGTYFFAPSLEHLRALYDAQ